MAALGMRTSRHSERRRRPSFDTGLQLPVYFLLIYLVCIFLYVRIIGSYVIPYWFSTHKESYHYPQQDQIQDLIARSVPQHDPGFVTLNVTADVLEQQKILCRYRLEAARTIVVHLHIPKSGGTAFALALKSECDCNKIPRPQKGYCKWCPHVIPDNEKPVQQFTQNLWTSENVTYHPPYSANCRTYNASSRFFGFSRKNRTKTFYSQSRLTSGWPCGVHVGYARLRECSKRKQLKGIKHVMVTLFREPLARYVSEFYQVAYNRHVIWSWDWCMNRTEPLSMTQFFAMPVSFPFQGRVTKLLSGSPIQTGAAGEDWTIPGVREKALKRALGVVQSTEDFVFGLAHELDLTLELLEFTFRHSFKAPSACHSHQNASGCAKVELGLHDLEGKSLTLTSEQKALFERNNMEEKKVYDLAVKIFYSRINAMRSLQSLGSDNAIDRRCSILLGGEE